MDTYTRPTGGRHLRVRADHRMLGDEFAESVYAFPASPYVHPNELRQVLSLAGLSDFIVTSAVVRGVYRPPWGPLAHHEIGWEEFPLPDDPLHQEFRVEGTS